MSILGAHCAHGGDEYDRPAHFKVTTEVVNARVPAFSATVPGVGNTLLKSGGGFEPIVYRNKYTALEDSPDRVVIAAASLSHYDTLREGFLDAAQVRVYRIEDGKLRMVREDVVAEGGSHASGWFRAIDDGFVVPPNVQRFVFRWDPWNRPRAKYYFAVRAVGRGGVLSDPSNTVEATPAATTRPAPSSAAGLIKLPRERAWLASKPARPTNLRGRLLPDGALSLEWDPPADAGDVAGYELLRSDYAPDRHAGYYLQLKGSTNPRPEPVRAGDMVIVSKTFHSISRQRHFSNRIWGASGEYQALMPQLVDFFPDEDPAKSWEFVPHAADTPVQDAGASFLKLTLGAGVTESIGVFNHGGTEQSYYEVLEKRRYRVEAWLKKEGAGSVRFKFGGYYDHLPHAIAPIALRPGPQWQKHVVTFTPPAIQGGGDPGAMFLEFTGPGTFYIDNFRVYRDDASYLDLLPEQYEQIRSARVSALRTHGTIKTRFGTYDMTQFTNSGGAARATGKGNTLPQMLGVMRKAGVQPWLQIEFHMSPREWLGFIEYLAAPYDPQRDTPVSKPWAYKRYSQGQKTPWIDEFDHVLIELGNETWNGLFAPWIFEPMRDARSGRNYSPGEAYGLFQEHVIAVLKSSPYWRERKFEFVLGGWAAVPRYGHDAAAASPSSDYLMIAAYNGGWDEGERAPTRDRGSLFKVLSQVSQSAVPVADALAKDVAALNSRREKKLRIGTYEGGPGYVLDGLNNERITAEQAWQQEQVMKSMAAGTATIDSFLARAYRGFQIQNFFTLDAGTEWRSHAKWHHGGQAYPPWIAVALFNGQAGGDLLRTQTISAPTIDLKASGRRQPVADAPLAAVYAMRDSTRLTLFVVSRKLDGLTPVTVELPFRRAASLTLFRMSGDPWANNLRSAQVKVERTELSVADFDGKLILSVPPASTLVYVFDGVI